MSFSDALESKWEARAGWKRVYDAGLVYKKIAESHRQLIIEQTRRAIKALAIATPYYWSAQISHVVRQSSANLPMDTTMRAGRTDPEWWYFQKPLVFDGISEVRAVLVIPLGYLTDRNFWVETIPFGSDLVSTRSMSFAAGEGKTLGGVLNARSSEFLAPDTDATTQSEKTSFLQFYVASQLWLEQEIIRVESVNAERHYAKRLLRSGIDPQPIHVVHLRRVASRESDNSASVSGSVEWSCQWIVRGHWRQQFYPSTGERRPLWIMPYVKGPEEAPLKTPAPTVYAVVR